MERNGDPVFKLSGKRVWVAGHLGLVGAAICRRLARENCETLTIRREDLDLRNQARTGAWLAEVRPDAIFLAAARVGGIQENNAKPADFIYDNLAIQTNIIHAAHQVGVSKLLFLGSSCIYPKFAQQPIREEELLQGPLEPTNQWYAIAKIAGLKMCQAFRWQHGCDFISCMPTNLYGPGDNFDLRSSHVIPALIRKAHEAKTRGEAMEIWGSGKPRREFLFVDDLADGAVFLMKHYSEPGTINVGTGEDLTIQALSELIARIVGFEGERIFDPSKPDGTPRKLLDVRRINELGWKADTPLEEGLSKTYRWFLENFC